MEAKSEHFKFQGTIFFSSFIRKKKPFIKLFPEGTLLLMYFEKEKTRAQASATSVEFLNDSAALASTLRQRSRKRDVVCSGTTSSANPEEKSGAALAELPPCSRRLVAACVLTQQEEKSPNQNPTSHQV